MFTIEAGQRLAAQADYIVEVGGEYAATDLVPCRHESEPEGTATCAFLAIFVATGNYEEQ